MRNKLLFGFATVGILLGCYAAYLFGLTNPPLPPVFEPSTNPYPSAIYAEGIVESVQSSGSNISVYPEVSGTVRQVLVREGQTVHTGDPLVHIDETVQRATTEQQQAQAQAAHSLLDELQAQPRPENLEIAKAQVVAAQASVKTTFDALEKQQTAFRADARTVSKDALDAATNAGEVAKANLSVAQRQLELTKAGAWSYDIENQKMQYEAFVKSYRASAALLDKFTVRADHDGIVLAINTWPGSYISPQGAYDMYTQAYLPVVMLGAGQAQLNVRCYVDEILLSRMPDVNVLKAQMTVRGTTTRIPLKFERVQPFVSPKIELSDQRQERVDVRVLPVVFSFDKPANINLFPGELVDVYIGK